MIVGLELLFRQYLPEPQAYAIFPPHTESIFVPGETATPGVSGDGRFITNSYGMRSDEPPNSAHKVLYVFGGSTAVELYLDQTEIWSEGVEAKINNETPTSPIWAGNLARSSLATRHNLLIFEHLMPNIPKPDLIVNLVGVNDMQIALRSSYLPNMTDEDHLAWTFSERPRDDAPYWESLALVRLYTRIVDWWKRKRIGVVQTYQADGRLQWRKCRQTAPVANLVDELPNLTGAITAYQQNILKLNELGEKFGARTLFLTQPTLWQEVMAPKEASILHTGGIGPNGEWCIKQRYYSPKALASAMKKFNDALLEICQKNKLHCFDLAGAIPKQYKYFYDDMHFSEQGSRLVAQKIFSTLRDQNLLEFN